MKCVQKFLHNFDNTGKFLITGFGAFVYIFSCNLSHAAGISSKDYVDNVISDKVSSSDLAGIIATAITSKVDKVVPSAAGNIATLTDSGNLSDSGIVLSNIAKKTDLDTKVSLTGDETIAGNKTFTGAVIVPTQPIPSLP